MEHQMVMSLNDELPSPVVNNLHLNVTCRVGGALLDTRWDGCSPRPFTGL